jgi:L-2,4-diaminobutyrate decarboxylase
MFDEYFLTGSPKSLEALREAVEKFVNLLVDSFPDRPYRGDSPDRLRSLLNSGTSVDTRIAEIIATSINVGHPHTVAHLHCPVLIPAVAAEIIASALNPSMDSFDQAPAATIIELQLLEKLSELVGYSTESGGTFTPGATQSNFFGMLLAREACLKSHWSRSGWMNGLPADARRMKFVCSKMAHFTAEKSAAQLGLGTESVVHVPVDANFRMIPSALKSTLSDLSMTGDIPVAVIATAGTTDFGSIDPLPQIAELAHASGAWLHVDAAYGGSVLFSSRHRHLLAGLEQADSASLDFHKLGWQPIGCGVFLLRDKRHFDFIRMHADYLNPEEHVAAGIPDLVTQSLLTTRRFDAFKLWYTLESLGTEQVGRMIDGTIDLAKQVADFVRTHSRLELLHEPQLGCVVFRYVPLDTRSRADAINDAIRHELFQTGRAVLGHTRINGEICLKITCLNPTSTFAQLEELLESIVRIGQEKETSAD